MRIRATTSEDVSSTIPCANCGQGVNGSCALWVHVADNPQDGPIRVNALSPGFQFCSPECRSIWWGVPTQEKLFPFGLPTDSFLSATVVHHDGDPSAFLTVEDDAGKLMAQLSGAPKSHHKFQHHHELDSWWSGDQESEEIPLPMVEK